MTRFVAALLYGVAPRDPVVLGVSTGIMLATSALAAYLPRFVL
ncbi:MAG TPA: hypothetical protein VHZ07_23430 [Bryobacteraceae bacterium]|nr:hypothetical protein [Bryobacteraceae bacterium]